MMSDWFSVIKGSDGRTVFFYFFSLHLKEPNRCQSDGSAASARMLCRLILFIWGQQKHGLAD